MLSDALIITGTVSLALLWAFAAFGGIMSVWDTFGDHIGEIIKRFKR